MISVVFSFGETFFILEFKKMTNYGQVLQIGPLLIDNQAVRLIARIILFFRSTQTIMKKGDNRYHHGSGRQGEGVGIKMNINK